MTALMRPDLELGPAPPEPPPLAALRQAVAEVCGVPPEAVLPAISPIAALDRLIRACCRPSLDAVVIPASSSDLAAVVRLQGAALGTASDARLVVLASPDADAGESLDPHSILAAAAASPETLFVIDESLIADGRSSLAAEAPQRPNLAILRVLPDAGVAVLIAEPALLAAIDAATAFARPNAVTVTAALATLTPAARALSATRTERKLAERARMAAGFAKSPMLAVVRETDADFILAEARDIGEVTSRLRQRGLLARAAPAVGRAWLRLPVGEAFDNDLLLAALDAAPPPSPLRRAEVRRETRETSIAVAVDLDSPTPRRIATGLGFFDHMLDQVAAHGGFSLVLDCAGDLAIDAHHTLEDCALALGEVLSRALGERRGIGRFGFTLPMDEAEASVSIDLGGRPYSRFEGDFAASHIGAYPTQMTPHVFRSLSQGLGAAIQVRVTGDNDHHKTEASFKAFGRALRVAIARDGVGGDIPSTKGVL